MRRQLGEQLPLEPAQVRHRAVPDYVRLVRADVEERVGEERGQLVVDRRDDADGAKEVEMLRLGIF